MKKIKIPTNGRIGKDTSNKEPFRRLEGILSHKEAEAMRRRIKEMRKYAKVRTFNYSKK